MMVSYTKVTYYMSYIHCVSRNIPNVLDCNIKNKKFELMLTRRAKAYSRYRTTTVK